MNRTQLVLVLLAGEQAAPNLLTARHFRPRKVFILHSSLPKSIAMAKNLEMLLKETEPRLEAIDDFDVDKIRDKIQKMIGGQSDVLVNVTGGTKPMSIGALEAARRSGVQAIYVRSQGLKTEVDRYDFDADGSPMIRETMTLQGTISLNDYLVSYFGDRWKAVGFGGDKEGKAFEEATYEILKTGTDEILSGWRDASNQVDMDFVIRCNNQIGIIQAKTGRSALSLEGIKQLALGGGQRFFGTYARRMLVIDRVWGKNERKLRELCEALEIMLVELSSFGNKKTISPADREKLLQAVEARMGKPLKGTTG